MEPCYPSPPVDSHHPPFTALENLALRQQLAILQRNSKRPCLTRADRLFWLLLSRIWRGWVDSLSIVTPETVIRWHRKGFKVYWPRKTRGKKRGRPAVAPEVRRLIRAMSRANPLWGRPQNRARGHSTSPSRWTSSPLHAPSGVKARISHDGLLLPFSDLCLP